MLMHSSICEKRKEQLRSTMATVEMNACRRKIAIPAKP